MNNVDGIAAGFLTSAPDPNRYGHSYDPNGSSGFICNMVPRHSRVLDVGCGDGTLAEILRARCDAKVLGIEPDRTRAEAARRRGVRVLDGYLDSSVARQHGPFDRVLFADVLEHVPDPFALVRDGMACLAPGGSLVISVPNIGHWSVRFQLLCGRFEYQQYGIMDATHLRWFTRHSILDFLGRAGLQPVEVRCTAGTSLDAYRQPPWSLLPRAVTWHAAVFMSRRWPAMFGCQTVVRAEAPLAPPSATEPGPWRAVSER